MQRFEADARPDCLDGLHATLDRLWAEAGDVAELDRIRFSTGIAEIVANVVEHGHRADGSPPHIVVEMLCAPDALEGRLDDDGVEVPRRVASSVEDPEAEAGRGLALARTIFDELRYERGDGHNLWSVRLRRDGATLV